MTGSITYSVGINGVNNRPDVKVVQQLLNAALEKYPKLAAAGVKPLEDDGRAGPLTKTAISTFQEKVLGWTGSNVDGKIDPGRTTWKALNGNVSSPAQIKPQPTNASDYSPGNDYMAFRQGDARWGQEKLGESTSSSIAGYGCALCTLTMAATSIGAPTEHWPAGLEPRQLTPSKANQILRKAGAFQGLAMVMSQGAKALGMQYDEYGRYSNLGEDDLVLLNFHLGAGKPIAAHVDYKGGETGDHWILVYARNSDYTYSAIDPSYGRKLLLTSSEGQTVNNTRYETTKDKKTGVLFGYQGSGGSASQQKYIVVRFGLLS